ncbi:LysR substrate-binding domain-containing protein [Actinomadura madurae]|uniref:LysR substrate-binding domain-containing protein n=1 Tax=Actinomadura madurae TaxID=1993 RepID=UPI0020D24595|nr:LysR substrate-binding domain-containing protein [Actinomadura madurae]MCP9951393.1 LysR substrate-binding domain-containing protein [Actinomadura madurae]
MWLPVPRQETLNIQVVAEEPRYVAFRDDHPLAGRATVAFEELLTEAFIALPETAGPLRDFWLALDERDGRPVRVGATASNADETFAALEDGSGVVLMASGNVDIYRRPGVTAIPVTGLSPSRLALAWRAGDHRSVIRDLLHTAKT